MIKNVIFDFDGTLVDSSYAVEKLYEYFNDRYIKSNIDKIDLKSIGSLPLKEKISELGVPIYKIPIIFFKARKLYSSYIEKVELIEGIPKLLSDLENLGLELNILSSNSVRNISHFFKIKNINCFSGIYSASNILKKSSSILKILKKKKQAKENILYVGDDINDIIACKKINVKVAAVTWGFSTADSLKSRNPDCICSTPLELYDYIYKNL